MLQDQIEFVEAPDSIFTPDNAKETFTYSAKLYDRNKQRNGRKKNKLETLNRKEIESMEGVSINETTGELTVDSQAVLGAISIKATDSQNTEISVQKDVKTSIHRPKRWQKKIYRKNTK